MSQPVSIQVLFCDATLLVVNKPAGLPTLPDGYNSALPHVKSVLEKEYDRLWIVHRLDKDTSGVLLLARTAQGHRLLNTQFEQHQVSKVYHALVRGKLTWHDETVDLPLRPNGDRQHRTVVDPQTGKPAVTHFKVLENLGPYCLVEALPETGRAHQIRAHLSALGLSIVGDKLYTRMNNPESRQVISSSSRQVESSARRHVMPAFSLPAGMALHAFSLEINHPLSGERLKFTASYPAELIALFQRLRASVNMGKA